MAFPLSRSGTLCAAILACAFSAAGAAPLCGGELNPKPELTPDITAPDFAASDAAVDCYMWQTFIALNWPADAGQRGEPDRAQPFGSEGQTVWESFKSSDEVFLKNGAPPGPWNDSLAHSAKLRARGLRLPHPELRVLSSTSKFMRNLSAREASLSEIRQADGSTLYDQAGQPVYYEVTINQTAYGYINDKQLYDALKQRQYAQASGIVLPSGSIEVKAAWKVLTPQELAAVPLRFHTARAMLPGQAGAVTVGLVGMHIFQMPSADFNQGFWATFAQVDNAPAAGLRQASYSFNNPACAVSACPPNQTSAKPTQLTQVFGIPQAAQDANAYVRNTLKPGGPWQFYQLLGVQWPNSPVVIGKPGQAVPLPNGSPSTPTQINPVLESFMQVAGRSCLGCHTNAGVSKAGGLADAPRLAASYSFAMGHAGAPAAKPVRPKSR